MLFIADYDIMIHVFLVVLSWFVDKDIACQAIKSGGIIEEEEVECRPEKIPHSSLDENVDIGLVRKYFSYDAWLVIEGVIQQKKQKMVWACTTCNRDLHSEPSIICDLCLLRHHFSCVALSKNPKGKTWFCRSCHLVSQESCTTPYNA